MDVNIEKEKVIVNIPEEARFYEFIQFAKSEVIRYFGDSTRIQINRIQRIFFNTNLNCINISHSNLLY